MNYFGQVVNNIAMGTQPPKHIRQRGYAGRRESINLDILAAKCAERNVDVNDIIAQALSPEREQVSARDLVFLLSSALSTVNSAFGARVG